MLLFFIGGCQEGGSSEALLHKPKFPVQSTGHQKESYALSQDSIPPEWKNGLNWTTRCTYDQMVFFLQDRLSLISDSVAGDPDPVRLEAIFGSPFSAVPGRGNGITRFISRDGHIELSFHPERGLIYLKEIESPLPLSQPLFWGMSKKKFWEEFLKPEELLPNCLSVPFKKDIGNPIFLPYQERLLSEWFDEQKSLFYRDGCTDYRLEFGDEGLRLLEVFREEC